MESSFAFKGQKCPICNKNTLEIHQIPYRIPRFGKSMIFTMRCPNCLYRNSDIVLLEHKRPVRYTIEIKDERDMNIRIIKSSSARIIIPGIIEGETASLSEGYISNIEGVLLRIKNVLEIAGEYKKSMKIKEYIKKIDDAMKGKNKLVLIVEDKEGNSAILSARAKKEFLSESL